MDHLDTGSALVGKFQIVTCGRGPIAFAGRLLSEERPWRRAKVVVSEPTQGKLVEPLGLRGFWG